ncbi:MAG: methionyl-tRNA formyltransferase [Candidatus Paceibacterota bacterium]|jgi:methionyl-tRNA formyltransferase
MFNKVKIVFFGSSDFSVIALDELKKLGIMPELIISTPDRPQGRKLVLTPTPVKIWAENNSVECITPEKLKNSDFISKISEYNLFVVASYGKIIPKEIIEIPKYKILNIHPSLLPKYRGASPLQEQILNNEQDIGVSVMQIDEEMDHGAIIAQKKLDILGWPTGFRSTQETLAKAGADLLAEILPDWIKGKIKAKEQNHSEATFTKKVEKSDGLIDIKNGDQFKNYLKILAYEEWPRAFFEIEKGGKKIKVIITKAIWKDGVLEIQKVIPEGKKEMDYKSFLLGL